MRMYENGPPGSSAQLQSNAGSEEREVFSWLKLGTLQAAVLLLQPVPARLEMPCSTAGPQPRCQSTGVTWCHVARRGEGAAEGEWGVMRV